MSLFGRSYKGIQEPTVAPEGIYDLRIVKAEEAKTKGREGKIVRNYISVTISIDNPPDGAPVKSLRHAVFEPRDEDEEDVEDWMIENDLLAVARFLHMFDLDEESDVEDWVGATASKAKLVVEALDDGSMVNKLVLTRME